MQDISFTVDLRIFPVEMVYSAAYILLDKSYILLDEEDEHKVRITIKSRNEESPEFLKQRFNEELLNYAAYSIISSKNNEIRHAFVQRALLTNGFEPNKKE